MSSINSSSASVPVGEMLQPESPVTVRYRVEIKQITSAIRHQQRFLETQPAVPGVPATAGHEAIQPVPAKKGYVTLAERMEQETVIFQGEFLVRPRISELAKLMEGDAP